MDNNKIDSSNFLDRVSLLRKTIESSENSTESSSGIKVNSIEWSDFADFTDFDNWDDFTDFNDFDNWDDFSNFNDFDNWTDADN